MNKISGTCETIKKRKKKTMTIKSLESQKERGKSPVLKNHWTKQWMWWIW